MFCTMYTIYRIVRGLYSEFRDIFPEYFLLTIRRGINYVARSRAYFRAARNLLSIVTI